MEGMKVLPNVFELYKWDGKSCEWPSLNVWMLCNGGAGAAPGVPERGQGGPGNPTNHTSKGRFCRLSRGPLHAQGNYVGNVT
jgi:hypothetical protein